MQSLSAIVLLIVNAAHSTTIRHASCATPISRDTLSGEGDSDSGTGTRTQDLLRVKEVRLPLRYSALFWAGRDSNPHWTGLKPDASAVGLPARMLPLGIAPSSSALQTDAMTSLAQEANVDRPFESLRDDQSQPR